jgi:putative ABC transport system permease protein
MFEDFINALRNYKTNKTRTILSLLGIIIGVGSVIMVLTIGESAAGDISKILGSGGLDLIQVYPGWTRAGTGEVQINEKLRDEIAGSISGIKYIVINNDVSGILRNGRLDISLSVKAVEDDYLDMMGFKLDYGRFFSVSEQSLGLQRIILGQETARYLFPGGEAVGKTLLLQSEEHMMGFEVAGVLKTGDVGMAMESPDKNAFIPRSVYSKKINPADHSGGSILIQVFDKNDCSRIQRELELLATEKSGGNDQALSVFSMETMMKQFNQTTQSISLLLSGIAGISLLVGGIGIMNIMIVTVTERKKEIGIRKALGASPAVIRMQFLVESATITLMGGIIGIIFGTALSALIISSFGWSMIIDWRFCFAAFAFSAVVGIFFGFHPAARAAKLDPVDALAGE